MEEVYEESVELLGDTKDNRRRRQKAKLCVTLSVCSICLVAVVIAVLVGSLLVFFLKLPTSQVPSSNNSPPVTCANNCRFSIVETIPENLTYPHGSNHSSTYLAWKQLITAAKSNITISSFYWTLRPTKDINDTTANLGLDIFNQLLAAAERHVDIRIVQGPPSTTFPNNDTAVLVKAKAASVRNLNMTKLLNAGILHTKMWIVDNEHLYIGSANMDWRSLSQVKELGLLGMNCSCLAQDAQKIFEVYWTLSAKGVETIPVTWPESLTASFSIDVPADIKLNNTPAKVFIGSSPPQLLTTNRTDDLKGLLHVINSAEKFIHIAVMDYLPIMMYSYPQTYWPDIDDALRTAAFERGVHVRVMGSYWSHTPRGMETFMNSLSSLDKIGQHNGSIETKMFVVPQLQNKNIPFTRVNHNKYMVTDNAAYIGTSNWSGDYFVNTGGVSCVVNQTNTTASLRGTVTIQGQLEATFDRDWNSPYAQNITIQDN